MDFLDELLELRARSAGVKRTNFRRYLAQGTNIRALIREFDRSLFRNGGLTAAFLRRGFDFRVRVLPTRRDKYATTYWDTVRKKVTVDFYVLGPDGTHFPLSNMDGRECDHATCYVRLVSHEYVHMLEYFARSALRSNYLHDKSHDSAVFLTWYGMLFT